MASSSLRLGTYDPGAELSNTQAYLSMVHEASMVNAKPQQLRSDGQWFDIEPLDPNAAPMSVKELQGFLVKAGFAPFLEQDGYFGYRTFAAVRLFQEYVRTVDRDAGIGTPDGWPGTTTIKYIKSWGDRKAEYAEFSAKQPSREYSQWLHLLENVKARYLEHPTVMIDKVRRFTGNSASLKVDDWIFRPEDIHLIGIRQNQEAALDQRVYDDAFVLLINGMVFKFYGSTDPTSTSNEKGAPFLVHGQHSYRLGWHQMTDMRKVSRGLKPVDPGVLVLRDSERDGLSTKDVEDGELEVNNSINIHWGGRWVGSDRLWSQGCQVVSGKGYIDHRGNPQDCSAFASFSSTIKNGKTKGAFNVLADLVTSFCDLDSKGTSTVVYYTLLYGQDLEDNAGLQVISEDDRKIFHTLENIGV
jgi:hypothetical protein